MQWEKEVGQIQPKKWTGKGISRTVRIPSDLDAELERIRQSLGYQRSEMVVMLLGAKIEDIIREERMEQAETRAARKR